MSRNGTSPEQIEADIERQREELAGTVSQLQAKLDVKSRARHKATDLKSRITTSSGRPRPELLAAGLAIVAITGLAVWRNRR